MPTDTEKEQNQCGSWARWERLVHAVDGAEANARLIAAAPEMLRALEIASDKLADLSGLLADRHAVVLNDIRDAIDGAIAKAEGQPSHA